MPWSRSGRPVPRRRLRSVVAVMAAVPSLLLAVAACGDDDAGTGPAAGDDEHKITVAGDSISVGLGSQLREVVADAEGAEDVVVKVIGEPGTGLARPDRFDWPARLEQLAREFPPEVLVFSLGSNDAQDLTDVDGEVVVTMADEEAWDAEYSRRLAAAFDAFRPADGEEPATKVVWVGHVRTAEDDVADTNRRVHRLAADVAASRPWVEVRDLAELLEVGESTATRCLLADGLHLTTECLTEAGQGLLPDLLPS